jgi:hypothetical protein
MCAGCAAVGATMYAFEATGQMKGSLNGKSRDERLEHQKAFFKQAASTEEA